MNPDLWKKVDALLEEALAQPPDEREAFVVEASKDDAELRDEVLSLLKAQAQASNFMERSWSATKCHGRVLSATRRSSLLSRAR